MTTRTTQVYAGDGRRNVERRERWEKSRNGDAILEAAMEHIDIVDVIASKAGKQKVRDMLLRVVEEIITDAFAGSGSIQEQVRRQTEVACKRLLASGWKSKDGEMVTAESVLRRTLENAVAKEVADGYEINVSVDVRPRG